MAVGEKTSTIVPVVGRGRREDINHRPRRRAWFGLKPFLSAWKPLRGWRVRHPSLCRGAPGWSSPQGLPDLSQGLWRL